MKINLYQTQSLNRSYIKTKRTDSQCNNMTMPADTHQRGNIPYQVYFGVSYGKKPAILELKSLVELPCAYCGKKMIQPELIDKLAEIAQLPGMTAKKFTGEAIELISNVADRVELQNGRLFIRVKSFHDKSPDKDLKTIFQDIRPKYLKLLEKEQLAVLNDVDKSAINLPEIIKVDMQSLTNETRQIIYENKEDYLFRRKSFLRKMHQILATVQEDEATVETRKVASNLPSSGSNINAFVVKYSRESNLDIAQAFLRRSLTSVEHIKPQNSFKNVEDPKKNTIGNLLLVHQYCNDPRADKDLSEYVAQNRRIIKNAQKQADYILQAIEDKKVSQDISRYLKGIKATLCTESKGLIGLNIKPKSSTPA